MKRNIYTQLCFICVFLMILFTGCGFETSEKITVPEAIPTVHTSSKDLQVDVYWDATYSMQGYVIPEKDNFYRDMPDVLEDLGRSMGTVRFFRFDESVEALEGRSHRRCASPEFYNGTVTAIHEVVDQANAQHVSIIVTDLFESGTDWNHVAQKIKEKYFDQHLSAAVIGIKNPFAGDVFDFGRESDRAKFYYSSQDDPAKYRPFYLLILGPDDAVVDFLFSWKQNASLNEQQVVLLSERVSEEIPTIQNMTVQDSRNLYGQDHLALSERSSMKEFGIDQEDEEAYLKLEFLYRPLPFICPLDLQKISTQVEQKTLQGSEWKPENVASNVDIKINRKTESESSSGEGKPFVVEISFTPSTTLQNGTYNLLLATITVDDTAIALPSWVKEWDMGSVSSQDDFDGSKTINFLHLMNSLKNSSLQKAKPILANVAIVVDDI